MYSWITSLYVSTSTEEVVLVYSEAFASEFLEKKIPRKVMFFRVLNSHAQLTALTVTQLAVCEGLINCINN